MQTRDGLPVITFLYLSKAIYLREMNCQDTTGRDYSFLRSVLINMKETKRFCIMHITGFNEVESGVLN